MNTNLTAYFNDPWFQLLLAAVAILLIACICFVVSGKKWKNKYRECEKEKQETENRLQEKSDSEEKLKMQEVLIDAQKQQILAMGREIEEARKVRHDYRQELLVLEEFARNGDREAVSRYLPQMEQLTGTGSYTLCENILVNTLLQYYFTLAREKEVDVDAAVEADETLWLSAADLSVMLGNLMVNAITAAAECSGGMRKIRVRTVQKKDYFAITIGNTFGTERNVAADGSFSSTKAGHKGIGLSSIGKIAEKYEGTAVFRVEEEMFRSNVIVFRRDYE